MKLRTSFKTSGKLLSSITLICLPFLKILKFISKKTLVFSILRKVFVDENVMRSSLHQLELTTYGNKTCPWF